MKREETPAQASPPQPASGTISPLQSPANTDDELHKQPCSLVKEVVRAGGFQENEARVAIERDDKLVELLTAYRRQFQEQVIGDMSLNIEQLREWAELHDGSQRALSDPPIRGGFEELKASRKVFLDHDQWSTARNELACWNAFHQFYVDALALGSLLLKYEMGYPIKRIGDHKLKRIEQPGASSYVRMQAIMNAIEQAIPNVIHLKPLRGLLPVLLYHGIRMLLPRPAWRSQKYLRKARQILKGGTLASYSDYMENIVERVGVEEFLKDDFFFDPQTNLTRHNIIFVLSHRHSFLDLALMGELFRNIKIASWSNIQYFPKSAASDPLIVAITPGAGRRMEGALSRTADLVIKQRVPMTIYADGGTPYLLYGQQMRIKPGIRLMLDYLVDKSNGTSRKTYIVPLSFDDTVAFVRGQDRKITLKIHQPICADAIAPAPPKPDRASINRGDPLLIYLEAHFLANTAQTRHAWRTPCVIDAVRNAHGRLARDHSLRGVLRRRFHASIFDLGRECGA